MIVVNPTNSISKLINNYSKCPIYLSRVNANRICLLERNHLFDFFTTPSYIHVYYYYYFFFFSFIYLFYFLFFYSVYRNIESSINHQTQISFIFYLYFYLCVYIFEDIKDIKNAAVK